MCGDTTEDTLNHVANPDFGRGNEYDRFMDAVIAVDTITVAERELFLLELYETIYGLCNHVTDKPPLSVATYKKSTDVGLIDPVNKHFDDYIDLNIHELLGLSLFEYLSMSPHVLRNIRDRASEHRIKERSAVDTMNKKLKESTDD